MNIRDHFCQLLDLPSSIVMQEAKAKLNGTIMRVNGLLKNIIDMDSDTLIIRGEEDDHDDLCGEDVKTIEFFLPDTGVYFVGGNPILLYKHPKRQWKKSFSWGFYEANKPLNIFRLKENERFEVYEYAKVIYYMEKIIGKKVPRKEEYICTNSVFQLEFDRFVSTLNG